MKKKYKRGLLKKYLLAFISIILISFLCLGIALYFFVDNYGSNEKKNLLLENAEDISEIISDSGLEKDAKENNSYVFRSKDIIKAMIYTVSQNINSDIFITDLKEGKILLCSNNNIDKSKTIPDGIINFLLDNDENKYEARTSLGEIYTSPYYTVGTIVKYKDLDQPVCAVFIASDASSMDTLRNNILKLFLFASIFACLIAFFVIWGMSYKLVKPLKNMVNITQLFSRGDFSKRVKVTTKDEIGDLGIAFNDMAEILEKSENTRKTFIANVSHELKTPMTTISGFIDGILDETIAQKDQKHYLFIVSEEIKRLSRLIKSMLNLSKIDSGKVKLIKTKFDLLSTTLNVFTTFEKIINEKNLEIRGFESCKSVFLHADVDMMYQVIYNLVENATKFVNKNGYIEVSLTEKHNNAIFIIKNSGDGISDEDLRHVFDRFYKADKSRSKDKNGMGLGLYLVKKILNLHGGNIRAKSVKERECTFEFFIPCDE